jgi:ribosomal-protein-alanine N-acetyltransferase
VALLPVNANSRRVVEKVGFRPEGIKRHYMHVAGQWRDHETWALLAEDVVGTVEAQLAGRLAHAAQAAQTAQMARDSQPPQSSQQNS